MLVPDFQVTAAVAKTAWADFNGAMQDNAMEADPLQTPVQFVPHVGPARALLLEKLGLRTVSDLLFCVPRDVLDLTDVCRVSELRTDTLQTVRGVIVDRDAKEVSGGRTLTAVLLDCGDGYVRGTWFNQPWMIKKFVEGDTVLFSGKPKWRTGRWEFNNPQVQTIEADDANAHGGVLPCYRLTEGLRMAEMRRITRAAVDGFAHLPAEYLPDELRTRHRLPRITDAVRQLHAPQTLAEFHAARHRLIFDDLLEFQLALAIRRRAWRCDEKSPILPTSAKIDARIRRLFPFRLTAGQERAIAEISTDLANGRSMHRLLQADVGAGKTAVAIYAMLVAVAAEYQTVLMAPTELLASQHWATIEQVLAHSRVRRLLLTGNLTASQRRQALADICSGQVDLIVGTQAIIQQDVTFAKLGLVVIDEQHKFGVVQRAHFAATANLAPHVLVMTATPIPRSLCLTQFGDLDLTAIKDMPPGRQPVVTSRVFSDPTRRRAWDFIRTQLRRGQQAFVVCPRVEAGSDRNPSENSMSAEEVAQQLAAGELREFRVGLIHGQLDREIKSAAMDSFRRGETHVLVSTTVVEVGVDVPNATLMVIQHAERFGLSQLHQLRGRIARGRFQGYCFLFSDATADDAIKRLSAMESTTDGFRIAEVDFELRGPGDVLGTRQHGDLPLRCANLLRDEDALIEARREAFALVDAGDFDEPQFAPLKIRVLERFGQLMDLPKSG